MSHLNSLLMWNDLKLIILFIFIFRIITSIILLFDFFRQIISHYFWSSRSMNFSFWHIKFSFGSGFEYILNSQLKLACKFPSYSNCFNCVFELLNFSCSSDRSGDIRIINDPGHSQLCHRAIELFSQLSECHKRCYRFIFNLFIKSSLQNSFKIWVFIESTSFRNSIIVFASQYSTCKRWPDSSSKFFVLK